VENDVVVQTERIMRNIGALLEAAGLGYEDLVKTTIYLADIDDFKVFNEVYGRFMPDPPPARTVIEAARLPMDILVEIDVIAARR
jgi:2-iminobutanoate/2-iminopropanoate deaminase